MKDLGTCPDCGQPLVETPFDWTCIWHAEYARVRAEDLGVAQRPPVRPQLRLATKDGRHV